MAVITGSFNSLVSGTISGVFQNTAGGVLSGVIGTPGPAGAPGTPGAPGAPGQGVPVGGTAGQVLAKIDGTNYNTEWSSLSAFLTKAGNLSGLTDLSVARQNLNLGSSDTPVFGGVDAGSGANVAHLSPTALSLTQFGHGQFTIQPSQGIVFPDASVQTTAWNDAPSNGSQYARQDGAWSVVSAGGDYLPLAGGTMDTGAQIGLSDGAGLEAILSGGSLYVETGDDNTTITGGKVELVFDDVALPFTIDVNGITFPDATVQTTAFAGSYLPLSGGTMTGSIYFTNAVAPIFQINDTSEGGTIPGDENYSAYTLTGLSFRSQNYSDNGSGGVNPPTLTYGSNLSGYALSFVNFNGSARASTMVYGSGGITFGNGSSQTIAFPGFNNVALTGSPTAPTPATSDNDTSIATTAYVKAQDFGDRYLTTSTTSNTISNGNKTFTIGTGLSYTPTQNITISYDAANHMHGEVLTYSTSTGVLTVDINHHTGSGTYAAWVVNVGGVTPATSVAWGGITGTLSTQTDLQNALDLKANLASPTFTGTPTLPTGTIATTQTPGNNTTAVATTAFVTAAVPAFATNDQALTSTSTTTALSPFNSRFSHLAPFVFAPVTSSMTSVTSGGGSSTMNAYGGSIGSSGSLAGYSLRHATPYIRGVTTTGGIQWQKPQMFAVRLVPFFAFQTASIFRMTLGSNTATLNVLANRGIGISFGASAANTLSALVLSVHNGTTLTSVTSSFTPVLAQGFDLMVYSDGAGNVTLYANDVQVATTSAGPISAAVANYNILQLGIENTTTLTTGSNVAFGSLKTFIS